MTIQGKMDDASASQPDLLDPLLDKIYLLPAPSRLSLKRYIREVSYPKGHILLRADKIETDIYFIKKGIVRAYAQTPDNEITFWFGQEGDTVISMKSYVENQKGYEDVELLDNCDLYQLKIHDLQQLFGQDIHLANWGRKFAEQELIKTEERLISRQFRTASQRYNELLQKNPALIQRVQLGYIASYLGITQVSLSRIRAELK
ncbi:CRP-like cAMP-binding protein [Runella defluvii]|uniref:CRP-like cAMP-binding protein n=1 Tax=Runella defluvii TaxID=370973 RepID=A0A7W5ZIW1_9BACT|nr:Crp/Fnr family transcriptional regulator [Runella defluvii]MBB3838098.1 CRP-like cAMP-binding protein [Runella defluvii]